MLYAPLVVIVYISILGILQALIANLAAGDGQTYADIPMGAGLCWTSILSTRVVP